MGCPFYSYEEILEWFLEPGSEYIHEFDIGRFRFRGFVDEDNWEEGVFEKTACIETGINRMFPCSNKYIYRFDEMRKI